MKATRIAQLSITAVHFNIQKQSSIHNPPRVLSSLYFSGIIRSCSSLHRHLNLPLRSLNLRFNPMATAQSMIASGGGSTAIRFTNGVESLAGDRIVRGVRFGARKWKIGGLRRDEFADSQHTQYYVSPRASSEKKEKEKEKKNKKKLKLLKRLSTDLQMFASEDAEGIIISEAQKVLLAELEKLRSEEIEKKKKKMEAMKSSESSSSCSSESSDSDCGKNVMVMKSNRKKADRFSIPESRRPIGTLPQPSIEIQAEEVLPAVAMKKIEVCMGGKCKKQGAMALMEDFQRKVPEEEAMVVTCKCMGKCKSAPNVRVSSSTLEEDGLLCIGVALDDVDAIVAEMMGRRDSDHYLKAMAA